MAVRPAPWNPAFAQADIEKLAHLPGALLPVLHALQERFGYIDGDALPAIARALHVSEAEVHGVVSFYHDFRLTPPAAHSLRVCQAEACQSMGCRNVTARVERRLGIRIGETTADGAVALLPVYCLGNCALAPSAMVDGELHGRFTEAAADRLLDQLLNPPEGDLP